MFRRLRPWSVALGAAVLWALASWTLLGRTGLAREVVTNAPNPVVLSTKAVAGVDVIDVDGAAGGEANLIATWRGAWDVPHTGFFTLALDSNGRSVWTIDGETAVESSTNGLVTRAIWLTAGFHSIEITHDVDRKASRIAASAAPGGEKLRPLGSFTLKPRPPKNPFLRSVAKVFVWLVGAIAIVAAIVAVRTRLANNQIGNNQIAKSRNASATFSYLLLTAILAHGALLRLDAVTLRYGVVSSPQWVAALQTRTWLAPDDIRTDWMAWSPEPLYPHADGVSTHYRTDPYIYLDIARKMTSFYEPQFREPVFPFATRLFLGAFKNQDVAVSFTSVAFSLLAIWLTYLLGATLWSRPAGLIAALGLSIDFDVISQASLGWRDDAYVAIVALCLYLMVRCWRAGLAGERFHRAAILLGTAGGLAILTRIMAVPFLAAGALFLLVMLPVPIARRLRIVGFATLAAVIVAGPYFLNCWRVHGDPLYTFNVHGGIYSVSEGHEEWKGTTASYMVQKIKTRPYDAFDTVTQGLTTYPFGNKFYGLERWTSDLRKWIAPAAVIGLLLLAALAEGRLLLFAMFGSLLPFAFTWKIDPHFRFTEHAYPLLLVATGLAFVVAIRAAGDFLAPGRVSSRAWWRGSSWRAWAAFVVPVLIVLWIVARVSPPRVFPENLAVREDATITSGIRDASFVGGGWTPVLQSGNVTLRVLTREAQLHFDLPAIDDYPATLRLDPFPEPLNDSTALPIVNVVLNNISIAQLPLRWTPGRVGAYDIVLPRAAVRRGVNRLDLRTSGPAIGFWYLRVHPPVAAATPQHDR